MSKPANICLICRAHPCICNLASTQSVIVARDKEWILWVESSMNLDRYYAFNDCQDRCDVCTGVGQRNCNWQIWQERKLSLQSSASLKNIMGTFPDLPDANEVEN